MIAITDANRHDVDSDSSSPWDKSGFQRMLEKCVWHYCSNRTSAAKAGLQMRTYGTGKPVPLSKTELLGGGLGGDAA